MKNCDNKLRLEKFQRRLGVLGIDCTLLVNSRDIFYYCGTAQPAILLVTPDDYCLMARKDHTLLLKEIWTEPNKVVAAGGFAEAHAMLRNIGIEHGRIGLELDIISAELYLRIIRMFAEFEPCNISGEILTQRMVKDEGEIEIIRKGCQVMQAGHQRVLEVLRAGMTELELAAEIECAHRKAGHAGDYAIRMADFFMSRGPLASGENLLRISGFGNTITGVGLSNAMPCGPSLRKINQGDLLVVDIPICYQGYHCDESRTYVLGGPSPDITCLFSALQQIVDSVLASIHAGASCQELFNRACKRAGELGVGDYFLRLNDRYSNFIGHGIGLEVNEPPILLANSKCELQTNMVVAVEIHLAHPQHGALKIEQMVLVTENGYELLSLAGRDLYSIKN